MSFTVSVQPSARQFSVAVEETIGVVGVQQLLNTLHIGGEISRIGIAEDEGVSQRLADLGLAAARHGGRLVAVGGLGRGAHEVPLRPVRLAVLGVDAVAVRQQVGLPGAERDRRLAVGTRVAQQPAQTLGVVGLRQEALGREQQRVVLVAPGLGGVVDP